MRIFGTRRSPPSGRPIPVGIEFDRLDHDGIAEILKSAELATLVHGLAEEVAAQADPNAEAEDGTVVDDYVSDRAGSVVTIRDARGMLWQARDGRLTKAAAAVGLEVKARA